MRAVLCKAFGPPESLVIEEIDPPAVGPEQLLLEVRACGVNYADLLIIQDRYQLKPPLPFSPGSEVAGVVREVGSEVAQVRPGDRVIVTTGWGGYAEELVVDAARATPMPDGIEFVTASAMLTTYGTSYYALVDRARLMPGETLLVLGAAGGVGLAAVELGKALGARVIAAASSEDKLSLCREHGADETVDYTSGELKSRVKELTGGRGADVVYDAVGGELAEAALRATAWNGRFLVVGFAAGIPRIPLNLVLLKGCQLVGVLWGSFTLREPKRFQEHVQELFELRAKQSISVLVSAIYPLERAAEALEAMARRRVKGKVVLTP